MKGRPFYDPYYDPLWATAVDLNVPVAFHGINLAHHGHVGVRYFDNFPLAHASGHAIESMLALGAMLTGGVFERFPALESSLSRRPLQLGSFLVVLSRRALGKIRQRATLWTEASAQLLLPEAAW